MIFIWNAELKILFWPFLSLICRVLEATRVQLHQAATKDRTPLVPRLTISTEEMPIHQCSRHRHQWSGHRLPLAVAWYLCHQWHQQLSMKTVSIKLDFMPVPGEGGVLSWKVQPCTSRGLSKHVHQGYKDRTRYRELKISGGQPECEEKFKIPS